MVSPTPRSAYLEIWTCGQCVHFSECKKLEVKNVKAATGYCQYRVNKFSLSKAVRNPEPTPYCPHVDASPPVQSEGDSSLSGWAHSIKEELKNNQSKDWKIIPKQKVHGVA